MRQVELATRIVELLRKQRVVAGFHIREQWVADALGVSRSPVRRALQELEQMDVVHSTQNQGYFLSVGTESETFRKLALPESEIDRIRRLIASERFATLIGDQVSVGDLCQRYGASRATILKVLAQMQEDGLVERTAGHGWALRAALTDDASYNESARFRLLIEPAVFAEPGFDMPTLALEAMIATQQALAETGAAVEPIKTLLHADADFHDALAEASGNRFLARSIQQITHLRRLAEPERHVSRERLADSFREHAAILLAVQMGDLDAAGARMTEHLRKADATRPDLRKARVLVHRRLTRH